MPLERAVSLQSVDRRMHGRLADAGGVGDLGDGDAWAGFGQLEDRLAVGAAGSTSARRPLDSRRSTGSSIPTGSWRVCNQHGMGGFELLKFARQWAKHLDACFDLGDKFLEGQPVSWHCRIRAHL